jgi:hypothetical protein
MAASGSGSALALAVLLGLPAPAFRALEPGWAASERAVARGADRFLEWTRAFAFDTGRRGDRLLVWARTQGAAAARDAGERLAYALDELRFRLFP